MSKFQEKFFHIIAIMANQQPFEVWKESFLVKQQNFGCSFDVRTLPNYSTPYQEDYLWKKNTYAIAGQSKSEDSFNKYGYVITDQQEKWLHLYEKQGWNDFFITALLFAFLCSTLGELTTNHLTKVKNGVIFSPIAGLISANTIAETLIAVYGTASIWALLDRSLQEQSTNPFRSEEARTCWLTTAASAIFVGTIASTKILILTAKAGFLTGAGTRAFCTALNVTVVSVSAIGVADFVYSLSKKEEMAELEIFQLLTNIFIFTQSTFSFKTASEIIKDGQNKAIIAYRKSLSTEKQAVFDKMLQARQEMVEPNKLQQIHGNQAFIQDLKANENQQEYFSHFHLLDNQQISVNGELIIHPKAFLQMTIEERKTILTSLDDLKNKRIDDSEFDKKVKGIKKIYRIHFETERINALKKMKKAFKDALNIDNIEDVKVGGENVFKNMQPHEIDRIDQVFMEAGKKYNQMRVKFAMEMADQSGCTNVTEVAAAVEYYTRLLDKKVKQRITRKKIHNPPHSIKAKDFYFDQRAESYLSNPRIRESAVKDFENLRKKCDAVNYGNPKFENSFAAANHFDKHHQHFSKIDPCNNISPEKYFQLATDLCSGPMKDPPIWTQDGSILIFKFTCQKNRAVAFRYDNLSSGTSVIATLMANDSATPKGLIPRE